MLYVRKRNKLVKKVKKRKKLSKQILDLMKRMRNNGALILERKRFKRCALFIFYKLPLKYLSKKEREKIADDEIQKYNKYENLKKYIKYVHGDHLYKTAIFDIDSIYPTLFYRMKIIMEKKMAKNTPVSFAVIKFHLDKGGINLKNDYKELKYKLLTLEEQIYNFYKKLYKEQIEQLKIHFHK